MLLVKMKSQPPLMDYHGFGAPKIPQRDKRSRLPLFEKVGTPRSKVKHKDPILIFEVFLVRFELHHKAKYQKSHSCIVN